MVNNVHSLNSSVGIVTILHAAQPGNRVYIPRQVQQNFLNSEIPATALEPTLHHTVVLYFIVLYCSRVPAANAPG